MFDEIINFRLLTDLLSTQKLTQKVTKNLKWLPVRQFNFDLAKLLVEELKELGLTDAEMDDKCYVMATLPSNTDKDVPVIGFVSHVDTSPAVTGTNVNPQIHKNYQGGDIEIGQGKVIDAANNLELMTW